MNRKISSGVCLLSAIACLGYWTTGAAAQVVFSSTGQIAADIQPTVDAFRASLGALNAGPSTGAGPSGRREVNWDGVPDAFSSGGASPFPGDFFNLATGNPAGRVRGIEFSTTGTFEVSADSDSDGDGTPGPITPLFGNRRAENEQQFAAFSAERLFGLNGTNTLDVAFAVPGSPGASALVRGFGVVFTDVEVADVTKLEFFDANDVLLTTQSAPAFPLDGQNDTFKSFSFVGATFDDPVVARVRITSGSLDLSWNTIEPGDDLVAMDDFIYGEPVAVPEPAAGTLLIVGVGLVLFTHVRRRRHRRD
jgi:hypothetical protein